MESQSQILNSGIILKTFTQVHSLLQLSERWPCHIWLVGRMKFASLEANLGEVRAFFSLFHSSFLDEVPT